MFGTHKINIKFWSLNIIWTLALCSKARFEKSEYSLDFLFIMHAAKYTGKYVLKRLHRIRTFQINHTWLYGKEINCPHLLEKTKNSRNTVIPCCLFYSQEIRVLLLSVPVETNFLAKGSNNVSKIVPPRHYRTSKAPFICLQCKDMKTQ